MKDKRSARLEKLFGVTSVLILAASVVLAVLWVFFSDAVNWEPYLALLGLLYAVVPLTGRWSLNRLNRDLKKERLTLTYALAYGYLNNYLAPVVRRLRKELKDPSKLRFVVYVPRFLSELRREYIDEMLVELENRSFEIETVALDFPEQKRQIDFRTAKKLPEASSGGEVVYFDFPTTLLILEQAVAYRLESPGDRFVAEDRRRLELAYIREFREHLRMMLDDPRFEIIRDNIELADGGPGFLEGRGVTPAPRSSGSSAGG